MIESITLENRNFAELEVDKHLRYSQILECLGDKEMTAKEIANEMYMRGMIPTNERNFVSPRLTELSIEGVVEPCGKRKCLWTGRTVTTFRRRKENGNMEIN